MAKSKVETAFKTGKRKRKGVHSKNASKGCRGFKTTYRGQGH